MKQQSEKLFDKDKISKRINFTGTKKAPTERINIMSGLHDDRVTTTIDGQSNSTKLGLSNRKSMVSSIQREKAREEFRDQKVIEARIVMKNTITQE